MGNVAVVGAQWGDEGKGKIVDWLSNRADVVVRFQGGHNAGHTLVVGDKVYKLSLLPSGLVQGKPSIIGSGVVVDPWHLLEEIAKLEGQGVAISPDILTLADNACLILPLHRDLDQAREREAAAAKIGTTGRGHRPRLRGQGRPARHPRRRPRRPGGAGPEAAPPARPPPRAPPRARPARDRRRGAEGRPAGAGAARAPLRQAGVAGARHPGQGRQAHPVRGRAGDAARRRPRHLSLRHLLQHRGGPGGGGLGRGAGAGRLCAGHREGLHHPRRLRPLPHRAVGRGRVSTWGPWDASSAWSPGARGAAAGSTRCWCARPWPSTASTAWP